MNHTGRPMQDLEDLKKCNPAIALYSVHDPAFSPYGRVLNLGDTSQLHAALARTPIPESGNSYTASCEALKGAEPMEKIRSVFGFMEIQAGYCNGRGDTLNALEYHKCSEVNFTTTGLVLLLALPEDLKDGKLRSKSVKGFYLRPDTAVEIYPRVLHFAPCRISGDGFNCLVVLEKGVNAPLVCDHMEPAGEDRLLWMRGKWMICHPDSPQAEKGAFQGISGENITIKIREAEK